MTDKKKATAPGSSVGADGKQPLCNKHNEIITDDQRQNNLQATGNVGITDKKSVRRNPDRTFCTRLQWKNYTIPFIRPKCRSWMGCSTMGRICLSVHPRLENHFLWRSLDIM